jgi:hypothetical protein
MFRLGRIFLYLPIATSSFVTRNCISNSQYLAYTLEAVFWYFISSIENLHLPVFFLQVSTSWINHLLCHTGWSQQRHFGFQVSSTALPQNKQYFKMSNSVPFPDYLYWNWRYPTIFGCHLLCSSQWDKQLLRKCSNTTLNYVTRSVPFPCCEQSHLTSELPPQFIIRIRNIYELYTALTDNVYTMNSTTNILKWYCTIQMNNKAMHECTIQRQWKHIII